MRIPLSCSTVRIEQAGPPVSKAQLNCISPGLLRVPSGFSQAGTETMTSRGTETAVAWFRSADRCSRIVVSERWVPASPP